MGTAAPLAFAPQASGQGSLDTRVPRALLPFPPLRVIGAASATVSRGPANGIAAQIAGLGTTLGQEFDEFEPVAGQEFELRASFLAFTFLSSFPPFASFASFTGFTSPEPQLPGRKTVRNSDGASPTNSLARRRSAGCRKVPVGPQALQAQMAMGQKPIPPVNIPIPTEIGSKMGGEFTYPKMVPVVLTHSQIFPLHIPTEPPAESTRSTQASRWRR